ncbi:MAG: DNA-directed RNA polymerase II subunit RPB11 [Streblomastix strix]|uniref:DNA-directed RNA polymerase II subunit RPB11 n=1 Tax=Streblomastix strix TaxID=222440 RepID=A0A5J4WFR7_9EUKA|nr:MAG: DNA-directed RNA polymerase II subunit RPB11 [Streblomastix strix]
MNQPERFLLLALPDGVDKISMKTDSRVDNAAIFEFQLEDHTIGNLLRMQLLRYPQVLFAAYQMPHPLENVCVIRIQTDGSYAIEDLKSIADSLETAFNKGFEEHQKRIAKA